MQMIPDFLRPTSQQSDMQALRFGFHFIAADYTSILVCRKASMNR